MTLITRLSRLFRADIHAVLDHIEEPELLLRQAIRDMEDDLSRQEQGIRLATHELGEYGARRKAFEVRLSEIEDELDLCFSSGKDELARGLVRRKLEAQQLVRQLAAKEESTARFIAGREAQLAENRASLGGLRQKGELFDLPGEDANEGELPGRRERETAITEDEIEVAFLREKRARSRP